MRIEIGRDGHDARVLLDDGTDVTRELDIRSIEVRVEAFEQTVVTLTVAPDEVEVKDVDELLLLHSQRAKKT